MKESMPANYPSPADLGKTEFSEGPDAFRLAPSGPITSQVGPIRVLIVDDHEIARRGIRSVLAEHRGIEVVGEISNGEEAVKLIETLRPEIVLLDISLPGISGIEVASTIRVTVPESRIIFVSQYDSPPIAKDALLTGATGYVVKSDAALDLQNAIETVLQGRIYVSRTLRALGWA